MKKKFADKTKIIAAFFVLLVVSVVADVTKSDMLKDGVVEREALNGEEKSLQLQLDIEEIIEDYEYSLEVLPANPTKEEAEAYFKDTIALIDRDFSQVKTEVPLHESYFDGIVDADWNFQPFGLIDPEGKVYIEKLEEGENIIQAQVELTCGAYEKIYTFSFLLEAPELSKEEQILQQIEAWIEEQMVQEGSTKIQLPTEMDGISLIWSEKKEYITPQILLLEVLALVLLWVVSARRHAEEEKKKLLEMEKDYPDIVSQLSLLLGAGMTTRQAWNRIASQYSFKRKREMTKERPVYEAILRMNRRLAEGESERVAYHQFTEEIPASCYHKLMRILLGNLEKGTQGICIRLEEESRLAFEKKILYAKKMGEEASTKMMMPLMLMMMVVMGIVMMPALIGFQL
ncbi:MAG: type II secretion system F family protein [Agathobacter sp.]|nr:type II secretion system F family protein [Agathobacter sp.]